MIFSGLGCLGGSDPHLQEASIAFWTARAQGTPGLLKLFLKQRHFSAFVVETGRRPSTENHGRRFAPPPGNGARAVVHAIPPGQAGMPAMIGGHGARMGYTGREAGPSDIPMPTPRIDSSAPRRGIVLVLSAASGSGKTTVLRRLFEIEPNLAMSVSATTRPPRPEERRGDHYTFVARDEFLDMVRRDAFLEHAEVHGNLYGTPRAPVEEHLARGRDVLCDLDWQGARSLRAALGGDCVSVFMLPPSMEELRRRLRGRGQDGAEVIRARLDKAEDEIAHWEEFDHVIVNHDRDACVDEIRAVLRAERYARRGAVGADPAAERRVAGIREARAGMPALVAAMAAERE